MGQQGFAIRREAADGTAHHGNVDGAGGIDQFQQHAGEGFAISRAGFASDRETHTRHRQEIAVVGRVDEDRRLDAASPIGIDPHESRAFLVDAHRLEPVREDDTLGFSQSPRIRSITCGSGVLVVLP